MAAVEKTAVLDVSQGSEEREVADPSLVETPTSRAFHSARKTLRRAELLIRNGGRQQVVRRVREWILIGACCPLLEPGSRVVAALP